MSKIGVRKLKGHTWCYDQGVALRPPACAARPPRPRARAARPPRPRGPPHAPSSRASRPRRPCNERRRADSTRDSRVAGRWRAAEPWARHGGGDGGLRQHARRPPERGAPDSTGGAAADRLAALAQSRAPVPGGVARVPAGTGDAGAGGEPDAPRVRAPPLRLFSIADHVVRTGGASLLRCGSRRWRLVSPSGTATRPAATRRAGASGSRGGRGRGSSRPQ